MRAASLALLASLLLLVPAGILGCATTDDDMNETPQQPDGSTVSRFGTLQSQMAIGAETTGWVLRLPEGGSLQVDLSGLRNDARNLQGQLVRVQGRLITKDYVESGPTQILIAESIAQVN